MKVIFLNRYFHPDHSATSQMLSDLAFALAAQGLDVHVVTSRQRYEDPSAALPAEETVNGVSIHRIPTSHFGRGNLFGRALDYVTFYLFAALRTWRLTRRGDIIVAKTDPPMLSVLVAPITLVRGAKLVNWLQDIFPEVAEALGVGKGAASRLAYAAMRWMRNRSLKSAERNVVLGERMAEKLRSLGVAESQISIIPNWADANLVRSIEHQDNSLRAEWEVSDAFVVGYSGNLGRVHDYRTILEAIGLVEDASAKEPKKAVSKNLGAVAEQRTLRIVWHVIGGGAQYDAFRREVVERQLLTVRFQPYQPRERLALSLSAADAHLVSLKPKLEGLVVPSKFYGVAAAGRPTIFVGDENGEIARIIVAFDCGVTVREGDASALARAVLDLAANPTLTRRLGVNARRGVETEFSKSVAVGRWTELLWKVAAGMDASTVSVRANGSIASK